jgi:histone-lysine N-methyltransferase SETMAR
MLNRIVTGAESWVHHYQHDSKHTMEASQFTFNQKFKVVFTVLGFSGSTVSPLSEAWWNVNSALYRVVLLKFWDAIHRKRPGQLERGVLLHHDNARTHTVWATQERIQELRWELLEHPPYSQDLTPSDFHLFGLLRNHLRGKRFADDEEAETEVWKWLRQQPKDFYAAGFNELVERCDKCIHVGEGYVEK